MAREVRKDESRKFIEKAVEFYHSSLENYQKGRFNVSVFDSSQAIILANDAFCVFVLGRRASKDHREAIRLHVEASTGRESKKEILTEALERRSKFGYTQVESTAKDAQLLLVRTKRFIDWVKGKLTN
jgi:HEPN domain-containing protein